MRANYKRTAESGGPLHKTDTTQTQNKNEPSAGRRFPSVTPDVAACSVQ